MISGRARVTLEYDASLSSPLLALGITRIVAELRAAGFEVEPTGIASAEAPAAESELPVVSYATVYLSVHDEQLSVEIRNQTSGTSSRLIILGREHDIPVLALKSAEFLRAGLVPHVQPQRVPARDSGKPLAFTVAPPRPPERSWQLDLGGALLTNLGIGDRLPLLGVHPAYLVLPRFALGAALYVPLDDARFEARRGAASYRIWLSSLSANATWLRWGTGEMTVGASAGLARTYSSGVPNAPLEPRQAALWSLALGINTSLSYQVMEPIALLAEAHVLTLSPSPVVAVVDAERRLGHPALLLGLSARIFYE